MKTRIDMALAIRLAAAAFVALAIGVAACDFSREEPEPVSASPLVASSDPLAAELARCRAITDPAAIDAACRRVWAQRRDRFFGAPR